MNRRTIIAIVMAVLCIGLLFAVANIFQRISMPLVFLTGGIGAVLIVAWIYIAWMMLKKKDIISHDQMKPERAKRRYKILKVYSITAGVLLLVGIIGAVGHNASYAMNKIEEPVFFFTAIVSLFGFVIATIGGWIYYSIGL
jgi:FtsH-binding integral membrane protein